MKEVVLITGAAGFIGSHLAERLLLRGYDVIGLDNFDDFYPSAIKRDNVRALQEDDGFVIIEGDVRDASLLSRIFSKNNISAVIHLAARAGVRPSLQEPLLYQDINIGGTINLLEVSRAHQVRLFMFASSSSVYGANGKAPFKESQIVSPISPYAASKASAEAFCHTYSYLYGLAITVFRLFTVYGPRQRPEMAISHFVKMVSQGGEIVILGDGTSARDYTYIDDVVDGFEAALGSTTKSFSVLNLGAGKAVSITYLVKLIEDAVGKKARVRNAVSQLGDVPLTLADISKARARLNYDPKVSIEVGIPLYVRWYLQKQR